MRLVGALLLFSSVFVGFSALPPAGPNPADRLSRLQQPADGTPPRTFLVLGGDWQRLDSGVDGREFRADLVYQAPSTVVQAGYSNYRLSTAEWSVGRFGAYHRLHPRIGVEGEVQAGPGRSAGRDFTYQKYRVGLTFFAFRVPGSTPASHAALEP